MPALSKYNPNKQELHIFNELNTRFRGSEDRKKARLIEEEIREQELLEQIYALRKDNNEKRRRIEEVQAQARMISETATQKRQLLTSVRADNQR